MSSKYWASNKEHQKKDEYENFSMNTENYHDTSHIQGAQIHVGTNTTCKYKNVTTW